MYNYVQTRIPASALSLLVWAALVSPRVSAVIPMSINYQGQLHDSEGKPVTDGDYDFVFSFYDAETGGNLLWSEEHLDVPVNNGLFQVNLGTTNEITPDIVTPPDIPTESFFDVFFDITVNGEVMEPRTPLSSTPYAMITHRVDGDITTSPGGLEMIEQVGFNYQKIKWNASGGEGYGEMEASDGFTVTKAYDKASPLLYQSMAKKKSAGGSDSLFMMGLIESDTIRLTLAATDGMNTTSKMDKSSPLLYESAIESSDLSAQSARIDKASPQLYQVLVQSGEGPSVTKRIDKASPLLYESTVESTDGLSLTREYDKASPLLYNSLAMKKSVGGSDSLAMMGLIENDTIWFSMSASDGMTVASRVDKASPQLMQSIMESGEGPVVSKRVDKSSPLLAQSTSESTDGATITKVYDKASPKLAMFGAHYMDIEDVDVGDSASVTVVADTAGVSLRQSIDAGDAALQAQLNTSILPTEEVSLRMTSSGSGVPTEEVCLETGPGSVPVGMWMYSSTGLTPMGGPVDTNFQVYATAEGGSLEMSNVGGTSGDGVAITITDDGNALRIRHGGANTGVYFEAEPSTGGRIGVNNEAPSEALQVGGNICASGTIGVCSDARFKKDVETIAGALAAIEHLRGVRFKWKTDEFPQQRFTGNSQVGFVAQEIVEVIPEVVSQGNDGYYSVDYGKLTPLLVEAIKELKTQNDELRRRVETLENAGH